MPQQLEMGRCFPQLEDRTTDLLPAYLISSDCFFSFEFALAAPYCQPVQPQDHLGCCFLVANTGTWTELVCSIHQPNESQLDFRCGGGETGRPGAGASPPAAARQRETGAPPPATTDGAPTTSGEGCAEPPHADDTDRCPP